MAKTKQDKTVVEEDDNDSDLRPVLDELASLKRDSAQTSERIEALTETVSQLDAISVDVKEMLRFRGLITGVVDKLYEEIEDKKADTRYKALKPFLKDLILLYDDLSEVQAEAKDDLGEEHQTSKALAMLADSVLEILYRADVESFESEGDTLDIATQRTIEIREVSDPELDTRILETVRTGFAGPEGVLRREEVVVGRYVEGEGDGDPRGDDAPDNENETAGKTAN